ncbi:nuclear cohesin complex subunit [Diplodia corticola]|uniref:Nuclear cohesin complex subunit n=1 Tax=Diplodia corticola TaxID=236234 RepID=A0A1J9QRE1_9PEZI|nr:nuclear cohesin complex subunit [Diplodia corticola]OJD30578.1 nuclear cohesin complex subunit [Diplodia corticola]
MEPSSPDADAQQTRSSPADNNETSAATRRKSGRVTRKPETIYSSAATPATKRKRGADREADASDDDDIEDEDDEDEDESSEGDADDEELRDKRRKKKRQSAAKAKSTPQRKPATKKSKPNGDTMSLAIRPATKAKKPRKPRPSKVAAAGEVGGLYGDVFAGNQSLNDVAAQWVRRFGEDNSEEMAALVNFVLRCAGCDLKIDAHDVENPDGVPGKLGDIQEEYQAQNIVEYPLIQKGKGSANFRHNLIEFFTSLIETLAQSELLWTNPIIVENIGLWINTMSSANSRPFRHTATLVSVTISSALCMVGAKLIEANANAMMLKETEAKKSGKNKARLAEMEKKIEAGNERVEALNGMIKNSFDEVFIHRYRDVDPRIRTECVTGLGNWIMNYPDYYFDGQHLRYLGWVLSDVHAPNRLEVVKQLQRLFDDADKLGGLRTFTERFRSRLVEMATQDADAHVRAATVELLDILREAGLIEPNDIDSVGRLIFDADPRVRKAVVDFFAENIAEITEQKIDELGGKEALDEALEGDEDYENPRLEWLVLKSLVESLAAYDEDHTLPSQIERVPMSNSYMLIAGGMASRIGVAAEALYDELPEIQEWEVIAGYLLFDHSQSSAGAQQNGTTDDPEALLKQVCKLNEKEETVLLDILNASVKLKLTRAVEAGKDKKKTKRERQELEEEQDTAARHLAALIPRLLNKFGAVPDAASAVLRLEHVLNLDVFEELRQDSTTYSRLLDDINKQFMSHGSEAVLVEASRALLHAKSYEELSEITEGKVQALWEDTVAALHALKKGKGLMTRGNLSANVLSAVSNTVLRISKLASISDCTEQLEAPPPVVAPKKQRSRKSQDANPAENAIVILIELLRRGVPNSSTDTSLSALEDAVVTNSARSLLFYFMWKVRSWDRSILTTGTVPPKDVEAIAERRDGCVAALEEVIRKRQGADELRLAAAGVLLDLCTLFTTLRDAQAKRDAKRLRTANGDAAAGGMDVDEDESRDDFMALLLGLNKDTQKSLLQLLAATEKHFAKKSRRNIDVAEDDDPIDVDDDPESSDEEDDAADEEGAEGASAQEILLAEQRLCELASKLVLAILGGVVDGSSDDDEEDEEEAADRDDGPGPVRRRLERNRNKLGPNFKEVVAYLDVGTEKGPKKGKGGGAAARAKNRSVSAPAPNQQKSAAASGGGKKSEKSNEFVGEETDEEDEEEHHDEEEELRREGLVENPDQEMEDEGAAGEEGDGANAGAQEADEESVIGD